MTEFVSIQLQEAIRYQEKAKEAYEYSHSWYATHAKVIYQEEQAYMAFCARVMMGIVE